MKQSKLTMSGLYVALLLFSFAYIHYVFIHLNKYLHLFLLLWNMKEAILIYCCVCVYDC